MRKEQRWLSACVLAGPFVLASGARAEVVLQGVAAARGLVVEGQRSWLEGGFGRLTEGAGGPDDTREAVRGQLHLALDWTRAETWLLHAHGVLLGEPAASRGRRGGLVEGFVQFRPELTPRTALRFKAGLFFPQTSLENLDPLWQSRYTLTLSALNTWVGEEVRLAGLETLWIVRGDRNRFELGAAVFVANDTSGALLAWRGFALGDRLTTAAETLPLPPLTTLQDGGAFADQRDDGTRPIDELDGRPGWQARARFARDGRIRVQAAYTDNRGDRALHRGQYSWRTRFGQAGLEANLGAGVVFAAEGALGDTGMGLVMARGARVDVRFRVGYALVSWERGPLRLTGRLDAFDNEDRDGRAEPNDEEGWALTGALLWKPSRHWRLGAEYAVIQAQRPAAAYSGVDPDTDARRALLELRFIF